MARSPYSFRCRNERAARRARRPEVISIVPEPVVNTGYIEELSDSDEDDAVAGIRETDACVSTDAPGGSGGPTDVVLRTPVRSAPQQNGNQQNGNAPFMSLPFPITRMEIPEEASPAGAAIVPPAAIENTGAIERSTEERERRVKERGKGPAGAANVPPVAPAPAWTDGGPENSGGRENVPVAQSVAQQCIGKVSQHNAAHQEVGRFTQVNPAQTPASIQYNGVFNALRDVEMTPEDAVNTGGPSTNIDGPIVAAVEACRSRYEEELLRKDGKIHQQSAQLRDLKSKIKEQMRARLASEKRTNQLEADLQRMAKAVEDAAAAQQRSDERTAALESRLTEGAVRIRKETPAERVRREHPDDIYVQGGLTSHLEYPEEREPQKAQNPVVSTTVQNSTAQEAMTTGPAAVQSSDMDVEMSSSIDSGEGEGDWRLLSESRAAENAALKANAQLEKEKSALLQQLVEALQGRAQQPAEPSAQSGTVDNHKQAMKHQLQTMLQGHAVFDGLKPSTDKVEDFLHDVNNYQERAQLDDQNLIFHFQSMLRKTAARWWDQHMRPVLPNLPVDAAGNRFHAVVSAFTKEYLPPLYKVEQRNRFHELKLENGNLLAFVDKFRSLIFRLPEMPESERWHALYGKITEPMRNVLHIEGITLQSGDTMKALASLHNHAKGLQRDRNKERTVAVHSAKRHYDSVHAPRDRPRKRERHDRRLSAEDRAKVEKIVVTRANYKDWPNIPFMTRNLRTFLRENNGCMYCRMINKPAEHTEESCAKQRRSKKKDF